MIREIVTDKERLAIPSEPIRDWDRTHQIVQDMIDTANHYRTKPIGCVGLAANQIGELVNIIIVWDGLDWIVMCNPEMEIVKGKQGYPHEGCLSRPGVRPKIKRHKKVLVAFDIYPEKPVEIKSYGAVDQSELGMAQAMEVACKLNRITKKFTGFTARIIQHEMDHLRGVYI